VTLTQRMVEQLSYLGRVRKYITLVIDMESGRTIWVWRDPKKVDVT
jgi:hypothetical protein